MKRVLPKIGAALVDILILLLVVLSIIISISAFTARANNGVPDLFGYSPFSVQTDSMVPVISEGDYIFIEKCDTEDLKVNDIVTYHTIIDGNRVINTHRVVEVIDEGGMLQYRTKGDNNPEADKTLLSPGDVIGKYNGAKVPVMGTVIDFLSTQLGFFLVILLPVLLFTIYRAYKLISVIMYNKKVDMINAANEATSDEVKEAIIQEYLAKQKDEEQEENAQEEKDD